MSMNIVIFFPSLRHILHRVKDWSMTYLVAEFELTRKLLETQTVFAASNDVSSCLTR